MLRCTTSTSSRVSPSPLHLSGHFMLQSENLLWTLLFRFGHPRPAPHRAPIKLYQPSYIRMHSLNSAARFVGALSAARFPSIPSWRCRCFVKQRRRHNDTMAGMEPDHKMGDVEMFFNLAVSLTWRIRASNTSSYPLLGVTTTSWCFKCSGTLISR